MLFKLAWRNIWRNKRRSFITMASVFFAVVFSIFMNSFQKGSWSYMLDNIVNYYYGNIQIHKKGYWETRTLDEVMEYSKSLQDIPNKIEGIRSIAPRLETFGLLSSGVYTQATLIVGTDPEAENELTHLSEKIVEGKYFGKNDQSLIVSIGLKKLLNVQLNDTLVILTQGYQGVQVAGKYPIKGFVEFASLELNKSMVYLPLKETQDLLGAENKITSLGINLFKRSDLNQVMQSLPNVVNTKIYDIMDWKALLPDLIEAQKTNDAGNVIFLFVLYLIISFGIYGTILMLTKERTYEFGVLLAIGMSRAKLAITTWLEIVSMAILGALIGMLFALPLVIYFKTNPINFTYFDKEMSGIYDKWGFDPIFPAALDHKIFLTQAIVVFLLATTLAMYAVWKIYRLNPFKAMKD